jgi:hypothetical protein
MLQLPDGRADGFGSSSGNGGGGDDDDDGEESEPKRPPELDPLLYCGHRCVLNAAAAAAAVAAVLLLLPSAAVVLFGGGVRPCVIPRPGWCALARLTPSFVLHLPLDLALALALAVARMHRQARPVAYRAAVPYRVRVCACGGRE